MAILNNNPLIGSGGNQGYNINNSLRFRSSASAYLSRTPSSAGNRQVWTWSGWIKRGTLGGASNVLFNCYNTASSTQTSIQFENDTFVVFSNDSSTVNINLVSTQLFRDPSAWYHFVIAFDTTQATSSNRIKIYVNGSQITAFSTSTYPSLNYNGHINTTSLHTTFATRTPSGLTDGYLAENNFIDGSAKTPSDFGETDTTTGVWKPKAYTGTYGTNGFYLKFSDIATTSGSNAGLGKDFSGNSNYWTTNNISVTSGTTYDAMKDSPTNTSATVANYATLNPLRYQAASALTYSEANLRAAHGSGTTSAGGQCAVASTMSMTSGKWYFEFILNSFYSNGGATPDITFGVDTNQTATSGPGLNTGWGIYGNGNIYPGNLAYGNSFTTNDIIGVAVDLTNSKIWFSKNGVWQNSGDPVAGTNAAFTNVTGEVWAAFGNSTNSTAYNYNATANFGQRPFSYTPPTGFVALNTYNLPTPTILQGNKYMDATLYTGNGSSQTITNAAGFRPDLFWTKRRNVAAHHALFDSVRGANSALYPNLTNAQDTGWTGQSFTSTGFTVDATYSGETNANTGTFVGWQWQAGQGSTSSGTGTGGITSVTQSVNTTAGFSIVTYTGSGANGTVTHGLGVAPKMIIIKVRNTTNDWAVYHGALATPATQALFLNLTNAVATTTTAWNSTAPTSSVFSVGTTAIVNGNTNTYVAYCFAEIAGFSKFGSYTGNGSTDGPFVYTGFRPKFIILKSTTTAGSNWWATDTSRSTYNAANALLFPNLSNAEYTTAGVETDILSNGFKLRTTNGDGNKSGDTFIYMAFAENPFKNSLAR